MKPTRVRQACVEELDEGGPAALALVESLERRVHREIVGSQVVNRLQVDDGPIGLPCEVLGGEGGLVEEVRALPIVGGGLDRPVVEAKELVPARLGPQDELDAVDRPAGARHPIQGLHERLDEAR